MFLDLYRVLGRAGSYRFLFSNFAGFVMFILRFFFLLLFSFLFSNFAQAAGTVTGSTSWSPNPYTQIFPSADLACAFFNSGTTTYTAGGGFTSGGSQQNCKVYINGVYSWVGGSITLRGSVCPANSTGTTTCTCNTGFAPDTAGTSCISAAVCPAAGTLHSSGYFNIGTIPTGKLLTKACVNSCEITLQSGFTPAAKSLINGVTHYFGSAKYIHTSTACSPDTPNFLADFVGTLPAGTCAAGQQMISMNGVTKCFTSTGSEVNTNSASSVQATKTLADAAAAQAAQNAAQAAASAVLAANPAATPAEILAAKQTAAAQAAASVSQNQPSDPQQAFCVANPTAPICQSGAQAKAAGSLPSNTNGSWYTKTYPNGVQGVLTANFNVMKSTPLFGLINNIVPTISAPAASGCFTLSIWHYGNQQLCVPAGVLNFVGICMMLTALFAARSIIFGG